VQMTMTNNDTRNTQKTGFINNSNYTYTGKIATDAITLIEGQTVIDTNIVYATGSPALYVVIKQGVTQLEYAVSDYPALTSGYNGLVYYWQTSPGNYAIQINLPTIDGTQQVIPQAGQWIITLYTQRDAQRSSLSTALKPRADL